jgi:hypothetical protein
MVQPLHLLFTRADGAEKVTVVIMRLADKLVDAP